MYKIALRHRKQAGKDYHNCSSVPRSLNKGAVDERGIYSTKKGDRWGSNPQPLEPQSRALPIELRSPQAFHLDHSIRDIVWIVKRFFWISQGFSEVTLLTPAPPYLQSIALDNPSSPVLHSKQDEIVVTLCNRGKKRRQTKMSQTTPDQANHSSHAADEMSRLPELPPGIFIPAPSKTPRIRTVWPDAIDVIFEKDPACRNIFEALLYQSAWAILYHRIAHTLYKLHIPFIPRVISQFARFITNGIEIHPGAQIGKRFFIDHGAGVVIGETAIIGNNVMLYHQVTLGATGWWQPVQGRLQKRHPTIEDDVSIGVGTAILGPVTIGHGSKIGAMALILESVPPNSVVASKPSELLVKGGEKLVEHEELTQGWNGEMDYQI